MHLLLNGDDPRDRNKPIFGVSDEDLQSKLSRELLTTLFGKHRELFAICNNGTQVVTLVLVNSASPSYKRLIAMGSYTGAYSFNVN